MRVTTLEAAFQVAALHDQEGSIALTVFVATSLFLFGIVELTLYRRFDYATTYLCRMVYYAWWHPGVGQPVAALAVLTMIVVRAASSF